MDILTQVFQVCIIPILGVLTTFVIKFINIKCAEVLAKVENETAQKYIKMIDDTITTCVRVTNQTYVEALKKNGSFNEAAQKQALTATYNAVMATLSQDALEYIAEISDDTTEYIMNHIEASVNANK